ncbi:MAG: type II toxin-antitoxin system prevent-host-death family antitoxin [Actinophytocola sp.]|nr:type II toxin-antitoxin system prevent-host-death family antitoxin [Actinophytocola sp.]
METIGLRELNQNPSKAVARVRAGASIVVTDRGRPVLRMVPEPQAENTLHRVIAMARCAPRPNRACPTSSMISWPIPKVCRISWSRIEIGSATGDLPIRAP